MAPGIAALTRGGARSARGPDECDPQPLADRRPGGRRGTGRAGGAPPRPGIREHRGQVGSHPEHGLRIASISKTFTAIAVMQLWEKGWLDLDRPMTT
ncbi:serine hydrolase [Nakamurella panacisegetis]|uniref:serine hydrolase n=1 Tax=Nakamurella panacisegetis TaxID=1090615 RepID=UPI0038B3804F